MLGDPFCSRHGGKPGMIAEHLMPSQMAWIRGCGVPGEIAGRGVERPVELAYLLRDETFVGYRAHPQRKFGFAFVQIGWEAAAEKFERDVRVLAPQPCKMRRE